MATIGNLLVEIGVNTSKLRRELSKTGVALKSFGSKAVSIAAKVAGAFVGISLGAIAISVLKVNRAFESMRVSLVSLTGDAKRAQVAFDGIQKFASSTPFSVEEVTSAFIKLGNLGLAPSERALTSYGNTAGAMGKSLNQLVEAVADATTGEFERLKEFGIKAKSEGDNVSLTFQGVTTKIGKNAAEIQEYLIGLGETKFAGGMQRQADTLNGSISNLGDSWDAFLDTLLNEKNNGKAVGVIRSLGGAVDWLTNKLKADSPMKSLITEIRGVQGEVNRLKSDYVEFYNPKRLLFSSNILMGRDEIGVKYDERLAKLNELKDELAKTMIVVNEGVTFDSVASSLDKVKDEAAAFAAVLAKVSESKAWKDIFGAEEDVTARSSQFDTYAKVAKANIESGSAFTQESLNTLKSILKTAENNKGMGFSNNNLFEKLDVTGMAQVVAGLEAMAKLSPNAPEQVGVADTSTKESIQKLVDANSITQGIADKLLTSNSVSQNVTERLIQAQQNQPTQKIELSFMTDAGKVSGQILGTPIFIAGVEKIAAELLNKRTREAAQ